MAQEPPAVAEEMHTDQQGRLDVEQQEVEELSVEQCLELLETTNVGRIGRNDDDGPSIVTVNFAAYGGGVLIRSLPGSRLEAARSGEPVSFQADGVDRARKAGWSVLVRGRLRELADLPDAPDPRSLVAGPDDDLLWLDPATITGRRIPGRPAQGLVWSEVRDLGAVWFGRDADDLLG